MKSFWCSFIFRRGDPTFEYEGPWWVVKTLENGDRKVCAAVKAPDEDGAKTRLLACFSSPPVSVVNWMFVDEMPDGESKRFPREERMVWPVASSEIEAATVVSQ